MLTRVTSTIPIVGIFLGLCLYFYAASLYSDATTRDVGGGGYHHFRNYWCDLYVPVTYTGQINSGRSYALAATLALVATLFFFWFCVTSLFVEYALLALMVRWAGAVAVVAASLVFTPLHNAVIMLAAPLGFAAVLATCIGLARKREWPLLALGILAVVVCIADYLLWTMALLKPYQPLIQKSAFALVFLWVLITSLKVLRTPLAAPASRN